MLAQPTERLATIRKLLDDFDKKHEATSNDLQRLDAEKQSQLDELNSLFDKYADQLHREVEDIKSNAKKSIANRAAEIWAANPEISRKQELSEELGKLHEIRTALDQVLKRCDSDDQYLIEKHDSLENSMGEISEFLRKECQIPDKLCYNLSDLRREIKDRMMQFEREFNSAKDTLLTNLKEPYPFPQPDKLSFQTPATLTISKQNLILPNDNLKLTSFKGIIPTSDMEDNIYIVDSDNSKIKRLDLKTNQPTEVFASAEGTKLNGLSYANDDPVNPLFVTTEQSFGSQKTLRALFLRWSASGMLDVVQSVILHERKINDAFFARWPGGNAFCAINCSSTLFELCRNTSGISKSPFQEKAREHCLPEMVLDICALQANGERRLVASYCDSSLGVFKVCENTLYELQCIEPTCGNRTLGRLIGLPGGSVLVESRFDEGSGKDFKYGIACFAPLPDGTLAAPKRLQTEDRWFGMKYFLPPSDSIQTYRLVADLNDNLRLYTVVVQSMAAEPHVAPVEKIADPEEVDRLY